MKAFLIDPQEKTVSNIDIDDSLQAYYDVLECRTFDVVRINNEGDVIYVDDEGLFTKSYFFTYNGYTSPLAGKGLVLGTDSEGASIPPRNFQPGKVKFLSIEEAIRAAKRNDAYAEAMAKEHPNYITLTPDTAGIIAETYYTKESESDL
jgi:hypothetical protein